MNSLGISEAGTILRGSSTMEQKIRNNTNFSEPFCGPQMTGSLTNYQSRKTNNNQIESKEENIRINHLYIKDELYNHFEQAFQSEEIHPQKWYNEYVVINNSLFNESEHPIAAEDSASRM